MRLLSGIDTVNYGKLFSDLLVRAIRHEERELKKAMRRGSDQSVKTVGDYYESWLQVPLLKAAWAKPKFPELKWEQKRVDLCFFADKRIVADFELKPFFPVPSRNYANIVEDFGKQYERAKCDRSTQHYVVLIPKGELEKIDEWIVNTLVPRVESEFKGIAIVDISPKNHGIRLNTTSYASVRTFRISANRSPR